MADVQYVAWGTVSLPNGGCYFVGIPFLSSEGERVVHEIGKSLAHRLNLDFTHVDKRRG